jgi:hypothetical protein
MSAPRNDFVAFHFAAERDLRLSLNDALTKLSGHLLGIVAIQIQLVSNLFIREIQPHKIKAEHPNPQRFVVTDLRSDPLDACGLRYAEARCLTRAGA